MKTKFKIIGLFIFALAVFHFSCKDLPVLDDCNFDTSIIIEPNIDCTTTATDTCEKTFRMQNPELLPPSARITWSITKGGIEIPIDNPRLPEITVQFPEPGFDYAVDLNIVFDFQGCDIDLPSKTFSIGVDRPIAVIEVDTMRCIVGDCNLTFTNQSINADSWEWIFPNDSDNHRLEQIVSKSFNAYPDTFQIILIASNIAGSDMDTVLIMVEPITFISDGSTLSEEPGKILSIDENTDGSFTIIGTNRDRTFTEQVLRDGTILPDSRVEVDILPGFWSPRNAFECYKIDDRHIVAGLTINTNDGNQNAYLAAFDQNYLATHERTYAYDLDGSERGYGITQTPDNGFLICGSKSSISPAQPTGMLFIKLNANFVKQASFVRLDNNAFNQAFGIISIAEGYAVIGQALNPSTEKFEGCFFKMNNDLDILGPVTYYGENFIPNELIKVDEQAYIILGREGSTAIIKGVGTLNWALPFGDAHLEKTTFTTDHKLAIAGYTKIGNKEIPILFTINIQDGTMGGIDEKFPLERSGRIFSIVQTRDNGFVLGGDYENGDDKVNLIIRTNKMGKITQ